MAPSLLTPEQERDLQPKDEFKECRGCPVMVVVPAGTFMMGSPQGIGEDRERPRHPVEISQPFAVSKFEVTFEEWNGCVTYGDCSPRVSTSGWGYGRQPAAAVAWDDAKRYVAWLSRMTGKTYRLLSEAEWEYSARAGTQTAYWWGDEVGDGKANCTGCTSNARSTYQASTPVGLFAPNGFGLYDMHGNIEEWVEDTYQYDYMGAPSDGSAWINTSKLGNRVLRGGHWVSDPTDIRSASRFGQRFDNGSIGHGLRVARTLTIDSGPVAVPPRRKTATPSKVQAETSVYLAGIYRLSAPDHSGNKHTGILAVTYTGTFFALSRWMRGQVSYGAGHFNGEKLMVDWGTFGPAVYAIDAKGVLKGEWADGNAAEIAEPIAFTSEGTEPPPEGTYKVEGRNKDNSPYGGIVRISKHASGYNVHWEIGKSNYEGNGVLKWNVLTVEYGGSTPVVYALTDGGRLVGLWNSGKGEEILVPVR